jgi:hypothetical protein
MWLKSYLEVTSHPWQQENPFVCAIEQIWKLHQHPMATKKLGCILLYVLQTKLGNYINTLWQQEN